jgi:hypothetical protein
MLIANEPMWEGSVDESAVHVREAVRYAPRSPCDGAHHRAQSSERRSLAKPAGHELCQLERT